MKSFLVLACCSVLLLAMGAAPRYLEELRIGGGYGDAADGGADWDKAGALRANGRIEADAGLAAGKEGAAQGLVTANRGSASQPGAIRAVPGDGGAGGYLFTGDADEPRWAPALPVSPADGSPLVRMSDVGVSAGTVAAGNHYHVGVYQPADATLGALAEGGAAGKIPYWSATDVLSEKSVSTQGLAQLARAANDAGGSGEGLLALWRMRSVSILADWSGNGRKAVLSGTGTLQGVGKFGACAEFDGNGFYSAGNALTTAMGGASQSSTLAVWIKTTYEGKNIAGFFNANNRFGFSNTNGRARMYIGDGVNTATINNASGQTVSDGKWHLIAGVIDRAAGTAFLYVDGVQEVSYSIAGWGALSSSATDFCIASLSSSGSIVRWMGAIDECMVWGRALPAKEIEALYLAPREFAPDTGYAASNLAAEGNLEAHGGGVYAGMDGAVRGVLSAWDGSGGAAPGCLALASPNGALWYVFVEDDGTLKVHNALPTANADGIVAGLQE